MTNKLNIKYKKVKAISITLLTKITVELLCGSAFCWMLFLIILCSKTPQVFLRETVHSYTKFISM